MAYELFLNENDHIRVFKTSRQKNGVLKGWPRLLANLTSIGVNDLFVVISLGPFSQDDMRMLDRWKKLK